MIDQKISQHNDVPISCCRCSCSSHNQPSFSQLFECKEPFPVINYKSTVSSNSWLQIQTKSKLTKGINLQHQTTTSTSHHQLSQPIYNYTSNILTDILQNDNWIQNQIIKSNLTAATDLLLGCFCLYVTLNSSL